MITAKDIPSATNGDGWTDPVEVAGGYSVRVLVEYDQCMGAPWEEHDGHGPVSDWRNIDSQAPGERVLSRDGYSVRFYDFAEAVKIAKRDGWGFNGQYEFAPGKKPKLTPEARAMTPLARAKKAAEEDFENLRAWCNDEWHWITVGVEVSRNGATVDKDYCGGIEDYTDYWREHAAESAQGIIEHDLRQRSKAWRAALKEARERRYWINRGVQTA
jgi:hypothetical protein